MVGEPRRGVARADVDRVPRHVGGRRGGGDPAGGLLLRAVFRDRVAEQVLLVRGGAPAAVDDEHDAVARGGNRSAAQSIDESGREVGDARNRVVEDRRASGDGAVGLAERPTVLSWRDGTLAGRATVVGARDVDRRCGGRGRGRQRLVDEGRGDRRDHHDQAGRTDPADPNTAGRSPCWFGGGDASIQGSAALPARVRFSSTPAICAGC